MDPPVQPKYATLETWTALSGISRTKSYYLLAEGKLRAVKAGRRTLIDVDAGLAWLRDQPAPEIKCTRH